MIGSLLTRALIMALGYAYPAYECFKTVERNKPEIDQLRFWCQYWILVAALTIFERVGDAFISWLPMYSEAKLAFFVYLWYPKTRGTTYVYDTFFRPYVAKHETEIDRNLLELRTRAGDVAVLYWQKAATYGQTRFFEIMQYVASQSQSSSRPRPPQRQGQSVRQTPPMVPPRQPAGSQQQQQQTPQTTTQPPSTPAKNHTNEPKQVALAAAATAVGPPSPSQASSSSATSVPVLVAETVAAGSSRTSGAEDMQIEETSVPKNQEPNPPPKETVIEEDIRVTRGRLRKSRTAPAAPSAR